MHVKLASEAAVRYSKRGERRGGGEEPLRVGVERAGAGCFPGPGAAARRDAERRGGLPSAAGRLGSEEGTSEAREARRRLAGGGEGQEKSGLQGVLRRKVAKRLGRVLGLAEGGEAG